MPGPRRTFAQIVGVLLIALALLTLVSLISHSSEDYPNSSRPPAVSVNWAGRTGAYLSYGLLFLFGYAAYALSILTFFWGWRSIRGLDVGRISVQTAGIMVLVLLYCGASGLPSYARSDTAFQLGGWIGVHLSAFLLIPYFGEIGSYILIGALSLVTLMVLTEVDLSKGIELLSNGVKSALWRFRGAISREPRPKKESKRDKGYRSIPLEDNEGKERSAGPRRRRESPVIEVLESIESTSVRDDPRERRVPGDDGLEETDDEDRVYKLPTPDLLDAPSGTHEGLDRGKLLENARALETGMADFGVTGRVVQVSPGPVITRYEVEPGSGVKVGRILGLADDLALLMRAKGIRIQAPVPGKGVVGVEVPNPNPSIVYLREIVESEDFQNAESKLMLGLGKSISGESSWADLASMPHLLLAGATGSGKSVCLNTIISSMLFKASPDEVQFLLVDPKMLELTTYNDIPHLLTPVVTDPKKASEALRWAVDEMEQRYKQLAKLSVRNIADYNQKIAQMSDPDGPPPLPYIVIVVDEFADLIMTAPADIEESLIRLAQMARAIGIHLVLATQRPSVNVITGIIKANFPSRIAFQVASKVDSRTILDVSGAEKLLGRGDMLFLQGGQAEPVRVHGAYISGEEIEHLVGAIRSQEFEMEDLLQFDEIEDMRRGQNGRDELFQEALKTVVRYRQGSTSFLQRKLKIGYSRAARLMDELEEAGVVGPSDGSKAREVLMEEEDLEE